MELSNEFEVAVPVEEAWNVLTDVERIAPCLPGAQLQEVEGDEFRGIVKVKVGPITAQYKGTARFVERDAEARRLVLDASGRDTRGQGNANATIVAELAEVSPTVTHVSVLTDLTVTGKVAQFGRGVLADVSTKLMGQFVENLETTVLADPQADDGAAVVAEAEAVVEAAAEGAGAQRAAAERTGAEGTAAEGTAAEGFAAGGSDPDADTGAAGSTGKGGVGAAGPPGGTSGVRRISSPEPEAIDLLDQAGAPVLKRLLPLLGLSVAAIVVWRLLRRRG